MSSEYLDTQTWSWGEKEAMLNHGVGWEHIGTERENIWGLRYGHSRYRDHRGQEEAVEKDVEGRGQGSKRQ